MTCYVTEIFLRSEYNQIFVHSSCIFSLEDAEGLMLIREP